MRSIRLLAVLLLVMGAGAVGFAQQRTVKVACIGDSVTYGTGIEDRENDSYPSQLQRMLGDGYEVGNFGRPGATLLRKGHRPYMQQPEFAEALDFAGDIAVIHLGLNDTDPRNWPNYRDEFVEDYLALINSVRKANPHVRVIIAKMSPITPKHHRFNSGTKQWHADIQKAIEDVALAAETELIDFHPELHRRPDLLPDSIHPVAEGAGILASTVYSAITGNYGGLQMPSVYSDGMVLQRGIPLTVRGTADAGTEIHLTMEGSFRRIKAHTLTPASGQWEITVRPLKAATGITLTIEGGGRKLVYKDVAAGEVWVCSGQSNMAFMVCESTDAGATPSDPDLRFFDMKARWNTDNTRWSDEAISSVQKLEYYRPTTWEACREDNLQTFSAVGYHFGKMLRDSLDVPVGLICNAIGGSATESWIDRKTLETEFPEIFSNWLGNDFIQEWVRGRAARNIGYPESSATRHPYEPCYLFESGIIPLDRFPVKGVIWYQGESNAHNIEAHEKLFNLLTDSWRTYWGNPQMPFHFVQLSSLDRPSWTWFRDSQRRLSEAIPHCGMAVSSDVGDSLDVHPRQKKPVGERLGRIALHDEYGFKTVPSGPLFLKATAKKGMVIVEFTHAEGLKTSDGKPLRCFEIGDATGIFRHAEARIEGNRVIIETDGTTPRYVRYAWQPFTRANLVNGAGLPASTFRAETE
ncbi:MAG: sialate O-acetylesterase [Bacteroidales bacterium]|nr:sialate O-acetylesterase [Bacteroidales bacterium]